MKKINRKKIVNKMISVSLSLILLVLAIGITPRVEAMAAGASGDANLMSSLVDGYENPDLVQGGMTPLVTLSEEEISSCEISEEELETLCAESDLVQAQQDLEVALEAYANEHGEELAAILPSSVSDNDYSELSPELVGYATIEAAADYIRTQMVNRKTIILVKVAKGPDSAQRNFKAMMEQAVGYYEGCSPVEGDYIRWNWMKYGWSQNTSNSQYVTYRIALAWRSSAEQEKWVTQRIAEIITQLDLKNPLKSEYQKVTQIYDYIMDTVEYDHYHYDNELTRTTYMPMYTAYTALKDGSGVCQAYALIFYRLCKEIGIEARLIAGNDVAGTPSHGWNIVKIGDYFYNVDATWDDETANKRTFFMKNMSDFWGHTRHKEEYETEAFMAQFPMAQDSYEEPKQYVNLPNLDVTMTSKDGKSVSTKANGSYKILYFYNPNESGSAQMLTDMADFSSLNQSDCEVVLYDLLSTETYTQLYWQKGVTEDAFIEKVLTFLQHPSNLSYIKQSDAVRALRNQYARLFGAVDSTGCCGVLVDPNNQIRWFSNGATGAKELDEAYQFLRAGGSIRDMGNLGAVQSRNNQVSLSWSAYPGALRYHIYRKCAGGDYACVGTTAQNTYSNTISQAGAYTYVVYASNGTDFFAQSQEVSVTCQTMYLKKGEKVTVLGNTYQVLSSSQAKRTVSFAATTLTNATKIMIPDTVMIDGMSYQVIAIKANALKNKKKLVTVSIGKNVQKIEKNAFSGCKKLSQIVVESNNIKSVGKNAFRNTAKKAVVFVPSAKLGKYKKLFAKKGLSSKAVIKK